MAYLPGVFGVPRYFSIRIEGICPLAKFHSNLSAGGFAFRQQQLVSKSHFRYCAGTDKMTGFEFGYRYNKVLLTLAKNKTRK